MNVITYRPWGLMNRLHRDLDRVFENEWPSDDTRTSLADWTPAVDIKEEEQQFLIRADLPGVDSKDIDVSVEDGVLTIRGERIEEKRDEHEGFRRVERVVGQFFRRFTLPDVANSEGVTARSDNGVLEIRVPKHPKSQPKRITVETA